MNRREFVLTASGLIVPVIAGLSAGPPGGSGGRLILRSVSQPPAVAGGGGGACTTAQTTKNAASASFTDIGGSKFIGTRFAAGASFTACKCVCRMKIQGASYTLKVGIFTNGGSNFPGTLIGNYSDTINANTIGAAEQDVTFVNMSASLTNGTTYHVVMQAGSDFNSPNSQWAAMGETITNGVSSSSDGSSWGSVDDFSVQKYILYS